ncbi:GHKL domain-containing protein [Leptobacterium flavescens]|uniref:histidine kinase n=1 Tax=Leptobacterium flavescens TaxID=472055 RepID=A0A6P0UK36_9FLAO|nr:ATP-binding protein [Leptobacterium flavescens]NER12770.1 GHKL domain-containing protein [Leptobacterium flavescens]
MHSLLKRQIRKFLEQDAIEDPELKSFLEAVDKSYVNYEEQLKMIKRAVALSSEELYDANTKLREEAKQQRTIIENLDNVISSLKKYVPAGETDMDGPDSLELEGLRLANLIEEQTREIMNISSQREQLLLNLEKRNEELNEYAYVVSHDLKSPLRNINTLTNWLKEDHKRSLNKNGIKTLDMILDSVEKMDALINGILSYSTIDKSEQQSYKVDCNHLVNEIIGTSYIPDNTHVIIKNKLPVIEGDKYRLRQLFQNLLQNAIHHIDKKKGLVEIASKEEDTYWQFSVKDNGKGIEKKYHEKIFKIFQKLEEDSKTIGMGLAIVKKIVNFYKGDIWLNSEIGNGATFYFTIKK